MVGERVEMRKFPIDASRERKGIEPITERHQRADLRGVGLRAGPHAVQRGLWRVVPPMQPGADPCFALQLDGRQEEVLQQPQVRIDLVHRRARGLRVIAHVAHQLAHMRPVLLLDVRVVVFLIGASPRELDGVRPAVAQQMRVDEFGPVIGVDAAQGKRQLLAQRVERLLHADLAFAQHRARFDPGGVDVGHIQRVQKVAIGAVARVTHQVHFREAGLGHVPVIGLDRNVVLQQRPRFRAPIQPAANRALVARQQPIHLAGAEGPHLVLGRGQHGEPASGPREPQRQQRLQPHRPRIARRLPHRPERPHHRRAIPCRPPPARPAPGRRDLAPPPNQRLAVIPSDRDRFGQQPALRLAGRASIPFLHPHQILLPRLWSHASALLWHTRFGNTLYGAMIRPSVTLTMARYAPLTLLNHEFTMFLRSHAPNPSYD
jgi:hypothetical protein